MMLGSIFSGLVINWAITLFYSILFYYCVILNLLIEWTMRSKRISKSVQGISIEGHTNYTSAYTQ